LRYASKLWDYVKQYYAHFSNKSIVVSYADRSLVDTYKRWGFRDMNENNPPINFRQIHRLINKVPNAVLMFYGKKLLIFVKNF
jgi:hypothetical protein